MLLVHYGFTVDTVKTGRTGRASLELPLIDTMVSIVEDGAVRFAVFDYDKKDICYFYVPMENVNVLKRSDGNGHTSVIFKNQSPHGLNDKYKDATILAPSVEDVIEWSIWLKEIQTSNQEYQESKKKFSPRRVLPPNK